ncbi:MAG: TIGR02281 family clan AA aspartic protease [Pseudomonadota bacterium]
MAEHDLMRLVYLTILLGVVGAGVLLSYRGRIGQMLQQAAIWFFIFVGGVVVYGFWEEISDIAVQRQAVVMDGDQMVVEVPRSRDGHYHLTLEINGSPTEFIVDTGATDLVLTQADAEAVGLDLDGLRFFGRAYTANGTVETAEVRLAEVALGDLVERDVRAVVNGGEMSQSLLGMSYLQQFGRIEIENDTLRLVR